MTSQFGRSNYVTERSDSEPRPKPEGHPDLSDKWVGAGHLKVGDKLKQADGTLGEVRYVNTIQEARTMYNLEVEEAHTFFVGTQGWLVHNCGPEDAADFILEQAAKDGVDLNDIASVTAVFDTKTGKWYYGIPKELWSSKQHPKIKGLINDSAAKTKQKLPYQCGNCSEFGALNNAMNGANPARKINLQDYQMYTFQPGELASGNIVPKPACPYCQKLEPKVGSMYPKKK
ncbi:polymorphic toxin-type HINT domain-containing protein [Deinococcus roseus]|uniref:Intein C-terminal splicing domain-containing protein n=1 Tax=Deinococcus roseus TaxID=392414 RepID=A0ABQ2DJY3_9DEIO|nr:polymorphic toxin-type HINT domain-containing protein [Deinococcus roseus]GGJ59141.1 hypothetical protein GCM10008938_51550 [Deinococcus roseus]